MPTTLFVEYFDTDASSYRHRLTLTMKSAGAFHVNHPNLLRVEELDGTIRYLPLSNIKQFHEKATEDEVVQPPSVVPSWAQVLIDEMMRRVEMAGFEVPDQEKQASAEEKAGFLLEVLINANIVPVP